MKLAFKLTLVLIFGVLLILMLDGYRQVRRTIEYFEYDMYNDHISYGRGLASAISEIWKVEGKAKALKMLARINRYAEHIQVTWSDQRSAKKGAYRASLRTRPKPPYTNPRYIEMRTRKSRNRQVHRIISYIERTPSNNNSYLYTQIPVLVHNLREGTLHLSESLEYQSEYIKEATQRIFQSILITLLLCSLLALAAGFLFAGRPIRMLVEKARRIGSGDFSGRLELGQGDEIGELAREMDLMSEQLERSKLRLEHETAKRIQTLDQLRHADRLVTIGKLASGIAHELGTPLNVISGRAQMIESGEVLGDEIRENANIISEQADRMTHIIRQLLNFARRSHQQRSPTPLHQLMEHTLTLFRPLAEKSGVTLTLPEQPNSIVLSVDAGQIQQALSNLVLNAIQAMPSGGALTLTLSCERIVPPAHLETSCTEWVILGVEDEGVGVPEENLSHIFDPFFTTKEIGQGTGLGLSVAYGIIREHGGWIDVTSQLDQGSTFRIYLPNTTKAPTSPEPLQNHNHPQPTTTEQTLDTTQETT